MKNELENKAEELEQTLQKQLDLLKKDSEDWLKVGGAVLVGGLLAYTIVKASKRKKSNKTQRAIDVLEREGLLDDDLRNKITKPKKSTFWPSMSQRLLILGLALAKEKFFKDLFNPDSDHEQKPKEGR
ncbi:hypothetical protein [Algoriphagus hitonicola]|uniref:Uncharacterized protein n=1 Tax=Algoriphagus hitonicola TaxID=435880 RepID=A0A1I2SES7_9BACT|nr:hypothetical protein [Algoriphagus hitonicola]SFG51268.1 hypothetical protein SAMN04487988_104250 [Algoriphagus hitonicola]